MIAVQARMSTKGQVVVPQEVREALGLREGDRLEFCLLRSGEVWIIPRNRPASDIFGLGASKCAPLPDDERRRRVAKAMAARGAPPRSEDAAA